MEKKIKVTWTCFQGLVRKNNEDNYAVMGQLLPEVNHGMDEVCSESASAEQLGGIAVFDGMGGAQAGETAAYLAAESFAGICSRRKGLRRFLRSEPSGKEICRQMNDRICQYAEENRIRDMGATAAWIWFGRKQLSCTNIGDSRIYCYRDGKIKQVSKDHVLEDYFLRKPPLTQHLGISEMEMAIAPYESTHAYCPGTKFLVCSDGLTDMLSAEEIETVLGQQDEGEAAVAELKEMVLDRGAIDNTTIVLCEVQ